MRNFQRGDIVTFTEAFRDTPYGMQLRASIRTCNISEYYDTPAYKVDSVNNSSIKLVGSESYYLKDYFENSGVSDTAKKDFNILPSNPDVLSQVTLQKYYVIADNVLVHVGAERIPALTVAEKMVDEQKCVVVIVGADLATTKSVTISKLVLN